MRKIISVIYLAVFLSFVPLRAQVTFDAIGGNVSCDATSFCVNVEVTNFDSIVGLQFAMQWDTSIMQIDNFSTSLPLFSEFNTDSTSVGKLGFSWLSLSQPNLSLTDGASIIEMCFEPNGSGTSPVDFIPPLIGGGIIEVTGIVNGVLQQNVPNQQFNSGTVTIADITPPTITCPNDTTIMNGGPTVVNDIAPSASDDCSTPSISYDLDMMGSVGSGSGDASGTIFNPGTTLVTYTALDMSNNSNSCSFNVTIDNSGANGMLEFIPQVNFDCDNNTVSIDVVVNNFDSLVGMQFGMRWDMSIIDFIGFANNLPEVSNFNTTAEPGAILFTWAHFSSTPSSTSLPDGSVIFTLNYNLVGNLASPLLSFEDFSPAIPILIGNEDGNLQQGVDFDFLPEVLNLIDNTPPTFPSGCPTDIVQDADAGRCNAFVDLPMAMATDECTTIDSLTYTFSGNTQVFPLDSTSISESFNVGTTLVTFTAYDSNGNSASCDMNVTINDNENPSITCPGSLMQSTDIDACTASVPLPFPTASDNCGIDSAQYTIDGVITAFMGTNDAMVSLDTGTTTVTYTVFDPTGNSVDCSFTVTVSDDQDPNITCPTVAPANTDLDLCTASVTLPFPGVTDNCGIDSTNYSINGVVTGFVGSTDAMATLDTGMTTIIYTTFDFNGNSASCTFTVTVTDNQDPSITCPAPITADVDMGSCDALVTLSFPTVSDNCGVDSVTYTANGTSATFVGTSDATVTFAVGTTSVTYTVHAGSSTATCSFDVTVNDTEAPGITCPTGFNQATDLGTCSATVLLPFPTVTDNCGIDSVTYSSNGMSVTFNGTTDVPVSFDLGTTMVVYTAHSGGQTAQCDFNVVVVDNELPTVVCPSDTSLNLTGGASSIVVGNISPIVADNCSTSPSVSYALNSNGMVTTGSGDASGQSFPQGTTEVTYFVVDDSGNLDSCSFNVIVNVGLSIECSPNQNAVTTLDSCNADLNFTGLTILSNPANISSITYELTGASSGMGNSEIVDEVFNVGTTIIEYTVMDNMGQTATCSFNVVVSDVQSPTISCPSLDVTPNDPGTCDAFISIDLTPTAADNCGIDSVTYVITGNLTGSGMGTVPNMTYPVGTTTITYTAHDPAGLTTSCSFDVAVGDTENPSIVCPNDSIIVVPTGTMNMMVTLDAPTTADNCNIIETSYSYNGNTFVIAPGNTTIDLDFPIGVTTVTATVTDESNNSITCTFDITLTETITDVIDCPADVFACTNQVFNIDPVYLVDETLTDVTFVIVGPSTTSAGSGTASGQTFEAGVSTVTYSTTTPGIDECSFTVTVDDVAPVFNDCPGPITAFVGENNCQATVSWDVPMATDADCGIALIIPSNSPPTTFPVGGPFTVSYVALDSAGNQAVCAFDINVLDTIAPVVSGCTPNDIVISDLSGTCGGTATWTPPSANDACTGVDVTSTHVPGDTFLVTTTVTYTFTDLFGNSSACSFDITIDNSDADPPVIVGCPTDTIIFTALGICFNVYNWVEPTVTDDCSNAFINGSSDPGDSFPLGNTTVTYIAFDEVGNEAMCSFNILVRDTVAPIITCPSPILAFATDPDECGVIVDSWTIPNAIDFCDTDVDVTSQVMPGDFIEVGTTPVTLLATDDSGNQDSCTFTIIVEDMVVPQIDCPGDVVVNLDGTVVSGDDIIVSLVPNENCDSVQVFFTEPVGTDNCPDVSTIQTVGPANNSNLPIGETVNYKYVVTDDFGLQDSCEFSITVNPLLDVAINAPIVDFCEGDNITLSVDSVAGATYTWNTPNGSATGATFTASNITTDADGVYTVVCELNGCSSADLVELNVSGAPIINAFSVNPICNEDLNLMVAIDPLSPPIDSFRWTGPNNFTATIAQPTVPNPSSGDYILTAYSGACPATDIVNVDFTVVNSPTLFSDCNETICLGESCNLIGTIYENPTTQYNWATVDGCIAIESTEPTAEITPTAAGTCVVQYWANVGDCSSDTATLTITVIETPTAEDDLVAINAETTSIDFDVLTNDGIDPNSNFTIEATSDVSSGTLTNNQDGTFTYEPGPSFRSIDQFIYEVCFNCNSGPICANAIVTIESRDTSCTVPTLITPNGDAVNDELIIGCLETGNNGNSEMIIYNQWGDEIYRRSPYGNGVYWDGTYNGSPVPDGTYFYVFKLDTNAPVDRGSITVFR